jgi:hypothetical protein
MYVFFSRLKKQRMKKNLICYRRHLISFLLSFDCPNRIVNKKYCIKNVDMRIQMGKIYREAQLGKREGMIPLYE